MFSHSFTSLAIAATTLLSHSASAFNQNSNSNLAVYWGQNSFGATHTNDKANWQQQISVYCEDDTIDAIPIAFLNVAFSTAGLPSIDVSNICNINDNSVFAGTSLPDCSFMASQIQTCQSKGKIVTLSIGGATGGVAFTGEDQANKFAQTIWDLFLGGSSSTRPFGNAVLDGVDLDLEGGSPLYWSNFVSEIRTLAKTDASKSYYVTGAPQCPFPDAYLGTALAAVAFDAIYVQFYNNYCGINNFNNPNAWNFEAWDTWAKTSPNPNIKIYIGAPASPTAAGSGYLEAASLATIIEDTRSKYSSFGGVMLWDASQAYANGRYDKAVKSVLTNGGSSSPSPSGSSSAITPPTSSKPVASSTSASLSTTSAATTTPVITTAPVPTTTAVPSGSCGTVASWVANVAYTGGDQVLYNGQLWTAQYWTYGDTPGGAAGVWTSVGACKSTSATRTTPSLTSLPASVVPTGSAAPARRELFRFKRQ